MKINLSEKEEIFQRKMNSNPNQLPEVSFSDFLGQMAFFSLPIASDSLR